jgi:hypothetical protein
MYGDLAAFAGCEAAYEVLHAVFVKVSRREGERLGLARLRR